MTLTRPLERGLITLARYGPGIIGTRRLHQPTVERLRRLGLVDGEQLTEAGKQKVKELTGKT